MKGLNMKIRKNMASADMAFNLRNAIWAFPYLAVMGLIWGYLADGSSGAWLGLVAAVLVGAMIGSAASILKGVLGQGAVNTLCVLDRKTIDIRERLAGDLNGVRYYKLCHRFDHALLAREKKSCER
jgi:hypothetical protein